MRHGLFLPPFGELADPRVLAQLAASAERSGWDGFFLWDHVVRRDDTLAVADPWIALAAVACATERVRIGALVTPLARRRPQVVVRQTVTLDHLSGGRLVVGVGLGNDNGRELSAFGEVVEPRSRAAVLDDALEVVVAAWQGEPVHAAGRVVVDGVRFLPRPVQQPRIPVWVAGRWPNRAPLRRALRYDGYFPDPDTVGSPDDVRAMAAELPLDRGFDLVVGTRPDADPAGYAEAGATWWLAAVRLEDSPAEVRGLAEEGPPRG